MASIWGARVRERFGFKLQRTVLFGWVPECNWELKIGRK